MLHVQRNSEVFVPALDASNDKVSHANFSHKKLRYREEHSTSAVFSWCTSLHFSGKNLLMTNQPFT